MHCHDVFVEGVGLVLLLKALCMLLASMVSVVRSFPNVDVTTTITGDFVSHTHHRGKKHILLQEKKYEFNALYKHIKTQRTPASF